MDLLKKEDIKKLIGKRANPCISIYMPAHEEWNNMNEDKIRFKNQLQEIEKKLDQKNIRKREIDNLLKPAKDLLDDKEFWNYQSKGLAVFISPGNFHTFILPVEVKETHYVSDNFYIKPLLPALSGSERYFLLALDLNGIKLYEGSTFTISEIELPNNTPKTLKTAMKWDDPEKSVQLHTGTQAQAAGQNRSAIFHGHGSGGMDETVYKEKILEFFRMADKGIHSIIGDENIPLLLAGVEYLIPIYKKANSYPNLFEKGLGLDPESLSEPELHKKAWHLIEPHFLKNQQKAFTRYENLVNNHKASDDLKEIVKAAHAKRIESLFINIDENKWGEFNPERNEVILSNNGNKGSRELLDLAAAYTLLNSGKIYALHTDQMPAENPAAAVFRY